MQSHEQRFSQTNRLQANYKSRDSVARVSAKRLFDDALGALLGLPLRVNRRWRHHFQQGAIHYGTHILVGEHVEDAITADGEKTAAGRQGQGTDGWLGDHILLNAVIAKAPRNGKETHDALVDHKSAGSVDSLHLLLALRLVILPVTHSIDAYTRYPHRLSV